MDVLDLGLPGLRLVRPEVWRDERGTFVETYRQDRYAATGIDVPWVQDNQSRSVRGVVRGLHYQSHPGQSKLVRAACGEVFSVAVDLRPDSPTFGRWEGVRLDAERHLQFFLPVGFAHGLCVLSEIAEVAYKVSAPYDPATECAIRWDDPDLGIAWPIDGPILSDRDTRAESFAEYRRRVGR